MPQRQFWTERHPVAVRFHYRFAPEGSQPTASLSMGVYDQEDRSMAWRAVPVPLDECQEAVSAALIAGWDGYLLGRPGDGPTAMHRAVATYRALGDAHRGS